MATQQTAEGVARELIGILVEAGRQPGSGMPAQSLRTKFGFERPGFEAGYQFAKSAGWITEPRTDFAVLTQLGFDEA